MWQGRGGGDKGRVRLLMVDRRMGSFFSVRQDSSWGMKGSVGMHRVLREEKKLRKIKKCECIREVYWLPIRLEFQGSI